MWEAGQGARSQVQREVEKAVCFNDPVRIALEGRLLVAMADRVGEADEGTHRDVWGYSCRLAGCRILEVWEVARAQRDPIAMRA